MVHGTGRGAPFLSRLCVSHLCESFLRKNFPDIAEKQRNGSDNGADICDRFRIVNAHNAEEMRQNECKRDQKNDFPEQCDKREIFAWPRPRKELCTPLCKPKIAMPAM